MQGFAKTCVSKRRSGAAQGEGRRQGELAVVLQLSPCLIIAFAISPESLRCCRPSIIFDSCALESPIVFVRELVVRNSIAHYFGEAV